MERRTVLSVAAGATALVGVAATVLSKDVRETELDLMATPSALIAEHRLEAAFLNQPQGYYAGKVAAACNTQADEEQRKLCSVAVELEAAGHTKAAIKLNLMGVHPDVSTNAFLLTWANLKKGRKSYDANYSHPVPSHELEAQLKEFNELVNFEDADAETARDLVVEASKRKMTREASPTQVQVAINMATGLYRDLDYGTRSLVTANSLSVAEAARALGLAECEETNTCKVQGEDDFDKGQYIDAARSFALAQEASTDPDEQNELAELQSEAWLASGLELMVDPRQNDEEMARLDFFIGGWQVNETEMQIERWLSYQNTSPSYTNQAMLGSLYAATGDCARAQSYLLEGEEGYPWETKANHVPYILYNVIEIKVSTSTYAKMATCLAQQ